MIKINCTNCQMNCCGEIKELKPILLEFEEEKFKKDADKIKTNFREMLAIKRKDKSKCIFLDENTKKCKIYLDRPFECQFYPLLLDFSHKKIGFIIDKRFCNNLKNLKYNKKDILDILNKLKFSKDWISAYKSILDC